MEWLSIASVSLARRLNLIRDYAFDPQKYKPETSGTALRTELGVAADEVLVVLVSKLVTPKGHLCFLRAAEQVQACSDRIKFAIVGGPVPGHSEEALAIEAAAKATPAVMFLGPREDLANIYAAADIAVHCPIYPDPYPTVVLLAMLMAKPIIGTRIGGIPEQIEDGCTGVLIPPADPRALADALLDLVGNPTKRTILGSAAMSKMMAEVSTQKQGTFLAELYRGLLAHTLNTPTVCTTRTEAQL
jgi:glycosyltransferase involved in cell wall biosynthesis